MPRWQWLLLPLSAALVVTSSLVPALCWLAFGAFVPALIALHHRSLRQWWDSCAWLFFLLSAGAYYWVAHVSTQFGGLPWWMGVVAVAVFAFLSLWQGTLGFVLFRWLRDRLPIPPALLFALCVVVLWHFTPALFFWDFSLLVLPFSWFVQGVDLCGAIGVDLLILYTNYTLFESWQVRRVVPSLRIALALGALLVSYGAWRTHTLSDTLARAPTARLALVQPNLDSGNKADPRFVHESLQTVFALSTAAAAARPALIVWPEAVFPLDVEHDPSLHQTLREAAAQWQSALLFGGNRFRRHADFGWQSFNTAFLLTPGSAPMQSYSKHVLLAFGEYIPFEDALPVLRTWFPDRVGQFGRGVGPAILHAGTLRLAPVICYESIVSEYIRRNARHDVDLIVEMTNDGWYGQTTALRYHKDLTVLRAMENRIGIARDTNTGVTTYIDPLGRQKPPLPLETAGIVLADAPLVRPYSLFTHWGHMAKTALGYLLLGCVGWALINRRRALQD